jgi:D-glycero-alpha-D-manno-heptose-7-phosphate kinase
MIISRTPLRMSFVGGGSDLSSFYEHEIGAVVSTTIDKYMYVTVNKKFDNQIRASYSITEFADKPEEIKHQLIRESLLFLKLTGGIEITSISDIPSKGTGLGSSSTYTVGLLNALHAYKGEFASADRLGREACHIEIEACKSPIGKQDQYAAAFGGLNFIQFNSDGSVFVDPIICLKETKDRLEDNLLMLYTGLTRSTNNILKNQNESTKKSSKKRNILSQMVGLAKDLKKTLEGNNLDDFGKILDANWELKKQMNEEISNEQIDKWYLQAKKAGAIGGKILGAGGGGFLLLYAPKERHEDIKFALPGLKVTNFKFEPEGSKIIYFGEK